MSDEKSRQKALFEEIHAAYYASTGDAIAEEYKRVFIYEPVLAMLADAHPSSMLDIACGRGDGSAWLRRRIPGLEVTGVEISATAAAEYERNLGARCYTADFSQPVSFDRHYDAAVVFGGIHHMSRALDVVMANIAQALRPGGVLIMVEPNADYMLEPARRLWYRLDKRNFDADQERALSHPALAGRFQSRFAAEEVRYFGGPGIYVLLHAWALRMPLSWKRRVAPSMMRVECAWHGLPGRYPYNSFIAKWRRRGDVSPAL